MATAPAALIDRDTPARVLGALAAARKAARQAEIEMMRAALDWAAMHAADSLDEAMTVPGTDRTLAIAGQGAPLVAEFAIVELAPHWDAPPTRRSCGSAPSSRSTTASP